MQFCINNLAAETPFFVTDSDVNFPFTNCLDDTLQTLAAFSEFDMDLDVNGNTWTYEGLTKIVMTGIQTIPGIVNNARVTITDNLAIQVYQETITIVDGTVVFDIEYLLTSNPIFSVAVQFLAPIYIAQLFVGHLYIGNPYTLPAPDFGSIPNHPSNDTVSETQTGKVLSTVGHTTRQPGFAVREVDKTSYDTFVSYWTTWRSRLWS